MKIIHVILSGGVGSRLWPLSRKSMPKQYIPTFGHKSLFQLTVERNREFVDEIIVVGNKENYHLSQVELLRSNIRNFTEIIEAAPRNTAAAIAFAALQAHPNDILLVTPSDHIVSDKAAYSNAVSEAIDLAKSGYLVTFGITPTKPEIGYGYIEFDGSDVKSFREKPDVNTAKTFIDSKKFLWNSGIFCFQANSYLTELEALEPDIFASSKACFELNNNGFLPEKETSRIPALSIDYAVMEKSKKIKVVRGLFEWSDLGSFESIWEYWQTQGEHHHFKNGNCIIGSRKHIEFLGVKDLILVETDDVILVLSKDRSQDVKTIYEKLEKLNPELVS